MKQGSTPQKPEKGRGRQAGGGRRAQLGGELSALMPKGETVSGPTERLPVPPSPRTAAVSLSEKRSLMLYKFSK